MDHTILESYHKLIETKSKKKPTSTSSMTIQSVANLPTKFGNFIVISFSPFSDGKEHFAILKGDVTAQKDVLVRLHSECATGDAIGSLRCDCRQQLEGSLKKIENEGLGVLLYLRQEGRGIGLLNKLKAYELQDKGLNTVEANIALGFNDDERDYKVAALMIDSLKILSIRLMTNNPKKLQELEQYGIIISERVEHVFQANEHNEFYLMTKANESGHLMDSSKISQY